MKLNGITDNEGSSKNRMRVGRGIGSGKGKTGGRGVKGQKARTGVRVKGFEGGQMPLHRRLPKRGFWNPFATDYNEVNIGRVQEAVEAGFIKAGSTVTVASLIEAGVCAKARDGVKILGVGEIKAKLVFEVAAVSKTAHAAIEKAGGSVKVLEVKPNKTAKPIDPAKPTKLVAKRAAWIDKAANYKAPVAKTGK